MSAFSFRLYSGFGSICDLLHASIFLAGTRRNPPEAEPAVPLFDTVSERNRPLVCYVSIDDSTAVYTVLYKNTPHRTTFYDCLSACTVICARRGLSDE